MANVPDRLFVGKGDRELYDRLEQKWILRGKTRREQFLLAMAYGFKNGVHRPLDQRDEFFFRKDFRTEDEAMLYAIAIKAEGKLDVLCDKEKVLQIAQEHAHAGIRLLADEFASSPFGSFEKKFERSLFETFRSFGSGSGESEESAEPEDGSQERKSTSKS